MTDMISYLPTLNSFYVLRKLIILKEFEDGFTGFGDPKVSGNEIVIII